jgi:hypothetical protein
MNNNLVDDNYNTTRPQISVAKWFWRAILIRDANYFDHFEDGIYAFMEY